MFKFTKPPCISSIADKKMQEISKYYLELTKKQHIIMTNKIKKK